MPDNNRQWGRYCEVVVGKGGQGISVRDLRITFQIEHTIRSAPNQASILIYNLNPDLEAKVKDEYTDVILKAGYGAKPRVIFFGNLKRSFRYREGNDWVTEIQAADGDRDYREATINETFVAGATPMDVVNAILRSMGATGGTRRGYIKLNNKALTRGKVISGSIVQALDPIARDNLAHWSIQNGELQIVPATEVLPSEAIVVNAETGMIGSPEISDKGITVSMLLNPQVRINGALKLDNQNIRIKTFQQYTTGPKTKAKNLVRLSPDGIYKVFKITHKGDTRGTEWYTTCECVAVGSAIPSNSKKKAAIKI